MRLIVKVAFDHGDFEGTAELEIESEAVLNCATPGGLQDAIAKAVIEPPTIAECERLIKEAVGG